MPPSASLTIRVGGREVSRQEFAEVAEAKFSHADGKDGRHHTVVCKGCSKSGHMQKAGSTKLAGGRTSHAFLCTNCGQSTTVINGAGEEIKPGGSEDNNPAPKMQEAEVSADHPERCKLPHAKMAKRGRRVCPECKAGLKLEEGAVVVVARRRLEENKEGTSQAKAATPEPFSKSKTSNWIARLGGLPPYIQHVAHGIEEKGKDRSAAIRTAIGVVKNWKDGKGNVDADTRAAAAKAWAQWLALRAKNAGKKAAGELSEAEERDWTRLHALFESAEPVHLEEAEERDLEESLIAGMVPIIGGPGGMMVAGNVAARLSSRRRLREDPKGHFAVGDSVRHTGIESQAREGEVTGFHKPSGDPFVRNHRTGQERIVARGDITHVKKSGWAAWRARHAMQEAAEAPPAGPPIPKKGHRKMPETPPGVESAGERVAHLQRRLTSLGHDLKPDGHFGPATAAAVKDFQAGAMLKEDGIVGPKTTEALKGAPHPDEMRAAEAEGQPGVPRPELTDEEMLSDPPSRPAGLPSGSSAGAPGAQEALFKGIAVGEKSGHKGVRQLQSSLGGLGYNVMTDGVFGPETEKTVKRFQRKYGLKPDGIVAEKTHRVMKTVGDRAKKLSEAVEARKAASGRDFTAALARERVLREHLEEGFNAAALVADALNQDPEAAAMVAVMLGDAGEATALLESNAGLEALIAKLIEKGIPPEQAKAVAAKAIGGGGKASASGTRGKISKAASKVEMHRMPNGMFAPKGQGQVLKAGQAVSVPHATEKGAMVPGTVTDVQPVAGMKKAEPGTASVELHSGPDKGKPFQVAASHDPAWAKEPADGEDGPADSNGYDAPDDPEIDPSTGEPLGADGEAEIVTAAMKKAFGDGEAETISTGGGIDGTAVKPGKAAGLDHILLTPSEGGDGKIDVGGYDSDLGQAWWATHDSPEEAADFVKGVRAGRELSVGDDGEAQFAADAEAEGQAHDQAEQEAKGGDEVWAGPAIGSKIKDKAGNEGEIVAHHDHPSGDPEKKMFSVKHPGGTSKVGYGKLADTMAGKKEWGAGKKPKGKPSKPHPSDPTKDDYIAVQNGTAEPAPKPAAKGDLSTSPGRGPSGKLRNFKAMSAAKLKKTIADLDAHGGDPEALAAVKKVAQEKGVAWADMTPEQYMKWSGAKPGAPGAKSGAAVTKEQADKVGAAGKAAGAPKSNLAAASKKNAPLGNSQAAVDAKAKVNATPGAKIGDTVEFPNGFQYKITGKSGGKTFGARVIDGKVDKSAEPLDMSQAKPAGGAKPAGEKPKAGPPSGEAMSPAMAASSAPLGQSSTPSPEAEMGAAGGMSPNTGNLSLKDMPLGTTFQMNNGKEYVLHKPVNDPYMIVKDAETGKGKPLHKMLAPPQVGPIHPDYEGAGGPGPSSSSAPAAPAATSSDDLFNKLSASVDVAKAAKASGASPAAAFKAPAAPATAPATPVPPENAALDAYIKAGGNDPAVFAALGAEWPSGDPLKKK